MAGGSHFTHDEDGAIAVDLDRNIGIAQVAVSQHLHDLLARDHAAAIGPAPILFGHVPNAVRMLRGKIVHLGAIGFHVVELPRPGILSHKLPFPDADSGVAFVLPEQRTARTVGRGKRRDEAFTLARQDRVTIVFPGVRCAGDVENGRHDVRKLAWIVPQAASLGNARRPVHDERCGDAAFMHPVLVEPKRRVRQVRPRRAIALIGVFASRHQGRIVAEMNRLTRPCLRLGDHQLVDQFLRGDALGNVLGAGAVVGQEDDQGVVELTGLFQSRDDEADDLVHAVDMGGIEVHAEQG